MIWSLVVPRGDWVENYATTNGKIILGMRLAFLFVVFNLGLVVYVIVWGVKDIPDIVDSILQILAWFIAGLLSLGVAQYIGKRQTTDPAVVTALSNAKIAEAVAPGSVSTTTTVSSSATPKPEGPS